jgi:hypothetical protein
MAKEGKRTLAVRLGNIHAPLMRNLIGWNDRGPAAWRARGMAVTVDAPYLLANAGPTKRSLACGENGVKPITAQDRVSRIGASP